MSTDRILTRLQEIRVLRTRAPLEVFELGQKLVESGWINKDTDQGWIVKEQLAIAALECGQLQLASVLIDRLNSQFPAKESQRVASLNGLLLEARNDLDGARTLYEARLQEKETDVTIRKRLISLHLSSPLSTSTSSNPLSRQEGIRLLVEYLDTYYVDAEGWLLLAKTYAELGLYRQALSASNHAVLLQPQNPFLLLYHAELTYTTSNHDPGRGEGSRDGNIGREQEREPLETTLKEFLRVIEMTTDLGTKKGERKLSGCGRRAAYGAKNCITRLIDSEQTTKRATATTANKSMSKDKLEELDVILTRMILASSTAETKVTREWLST